MSTTGDDRSPDRSLGPFEDLIEEDVSQEEVSQGGDQPEAPPQDAPQFRTPRSRVAPPGNMFPQPGFAMSNEQFRMWLEMQEQQFTQMLAQQRPPPAAAADPADPPRVGAFGRDLD